MPGTWPHEHWVYVWVPLFGALIWFSTITAMLITWLVQGRPRFVTQEADFPAISDIGADVLKPFFIAGCSITAVSFVLSLAVERLLRHQGRLVKGKRERITSCLAILGSLVGGIGLILLSVLDTKRFSVPHFVSCGIFMVGMAISALFTVIEYAWLSPEYLEYHKLKIAYILKIAIATVVVSLAIGFFVNIERTIGSILEWCSAYGFGAYILTFGYDLRMSKGAQKDQLSRYTQLEEEMDQEFCGATTVGKVPRGSVYMGPETRYDPHYSGLPPIRPSGFVHGPRSHDNNGI